MQLIRQKPHRLRKIQPFDFHDELNHTAAGLTAEAVIQLLFRIHGKGSGLFPMKRAQTPIAMSVLLQRDIAGYNLHNISPCPEFIQPRSRKA